MIFDVKLNKIQIYLLVYQMIETVLKQTTQHTWYFSNVVKAAKYDQIGSI
jgi:hypothetical protein